MGTSEATPALKHLSWQDVIAIDQCVGEVAKHKYGEVTIVVKDGVASFIKPSPSIKLGRGIKLETGPL